MGQKGMFYDECSCEKKQEGDKDDHVDQRGPRETMQGKQGVYSPSRMHLLYEKASKQIERQNKTAKQGQINMYIRTKIEGKTWKHEEQKKNRHKQSEHTKRKRNTKVESPKASKQRKRNQIDKKARKARKTNRQEPAKDQQYTKTINLVKKNNKAKQKYTAKNKVSRRMYIQTQNARKQSNTLTNDCTIRMCTQDKKYRFKIS